MNKLLGYTVSSLLALAVIQAVSASASAESVATRCDYYGCAKIVCHREGDHCYRADRDQWYGREDDYDHRSRWYGENYDRDRDYDRERAGWRYRCDYDGDHCDVRRERYREGGW